jgi:D-beta-D-heptose 7-phosphate kinase/D-beta-D-heptose 1-phosphate adenosyltransferase
MDKIRDKKPRIALIGDLMIDHYIWGSCNRISPEAPVQVVDIGRESIVLGGAGNVANNLVALDSKVDIYTVLGSDENGNRATELLKNLDIHCHYIIYESGRKTTKKSRVIASNQQIIRIDDETKEDIADSSIDTIISKLKENITDYDAILISDYNKGVITVRVSLEVIALANSYGIPILIDPKGDNYDKYRGATLLTPNKSEASIAMGIPIESVESIKEATLKLKETLHLRYGLITLSEEGIAIFDEEMTIVPTVAREVYDVTGAGDTVLASLGVALCSGLDIVKSCEFANKSAAVVVAKVGSATATLSEIEEYEHSLNKGQIDSKIKDFKQIARVSKRLKEQGRKVIFTNGCFDILHRGHASYLQKAKELGDILIVGLNSDNSIKRLKGESRPINPLYDRAFLLSALESVDFVVPFEEDTPYTLIEQILPHILVKGADYIGKEVVGSDLVDEVRLIEFVEGKSTTDTIKRMRGVC